MAEPTPRSDKVKAREVAIIAKRTGKPLDVVARAYDEATDKINFPTRKDRIRHTEKILHYEELDGMRHTYRARIRQGDMQIDLYAPEDTPESDREETVQTLSSLLNAAIEAVAGSPRNEKERILQTEEILKGMTPEQIRERVKELGREAGISPRDYTKFAKVLIGISNERKD
jgi:hypothetical protein